MGWAGWCQTNAKKGGLAFSRQQASCLAKPKPTEVEVKENWASRFALLSHAEPSRCLLAPKPRPPRPPVLAHPPSHRLAISNPILVRRLPFPDPRRPETPPSRVADPAVSGRGGPTVAHTLAVDHRASGPSKPPVHPASGGSRAFFLRRPAISLPPLRRACLPASVSFPGAREALLADRYSVMAAHVHTSPGGAVPPHHGPPPPAHQPNGHVVGPPKTLSQALAAVNEGVWLQIGTSTLLCSTLPADSAVRFGAGIARRSGRRHTGLRTSHSAQRLVGPCDAGHLNHPSRKGSVRHGHRLSAHYSKD